MIKEALGSKSEIVCSDHPAPFGNFVFDITYAKEILGLSRESWIKQSSSMHSAKFPKFLENKLRKKITMANPTFSKEDKEHILKEMDAILDGALSMGPHVNRFQEEFASRVGVDYAVAVNACTSALEIALNYFGVRGKEVIVPTQTFVATGVAVQLAGGVPVLQKFHLKHFAST